MRTNIMQQEAKLYLFAECPLCGNSEQQPDDQPLHHLQWFKVDHKQSDDGTPVLKCRECNIKAEYDVSEY